MPFLLLLAVVVALFVISVALMPKPKQPKPPAAQDLENPTAEAGREIPVIFGTVTIKGVNILDYTDKSIHTYEVKA
jgi:hypothetical protein